jgi:hypothetical protein
MSIGRGSESQTRKRDKQGDGALARSKAWKDIAWVALTMYVSLAAKMVLAMEATNVARGPRRETGRAAPVSIKSRGRCRD